MKRVLANLISPALISLSVTLPFIILELVNRKNFNEGFPFALFGVLWLLPMLFIVILAPLVRSNQAGINLMAHPVSLIVRIVLLILIALLWGGILIDQMSCFMGVPNCD